MVRPGMINLDFADVETVMSSMGKAMMGTGEAEGENRSMSATEMALNNPLIDDYSLKGAKGLLVNITGGDDLTLFEVEESVNKIRAEVDPEAELIFGAIEDLNLNGKIRVSIVATALDGEQPEAKTVLNMVNRIQSRNTGYSEGLFSKSTHIENNTFNSINGATALKLDERFETTESPERIISSQEETARNEETEESMASGISIESASYMESNNIEPNFNEAIVNKEEPFVQDISSSDINDSSEEYTPQLFSEESISEEKNEVLENESKDDSYENQKLFDQDINDEEDFEIPAFLRKQKF
jgi:cell division protein FtsZ